MGIPWHSRTIRTFWWIVLKLSVYSLAHRDDMYSILERFWWTVDFVQRRYRIHVLACLLQSFWWTVNFVGIPYPHSPTHRDIVTHSLALISGNFLVDSKLRAYSPACRDGNTHEVYSKYAEVHYPAKNFLERKEIYDDVSMRGGIPAKFTVKKRCSMKGIRKRESLLFTKNIGVRKRIRDDVSVREEHPRRLLSTKNVVECKGICE